MHAMVRAMATVLSPLGVRINIVGWFSRSVSRLAIANHTVPLGRIRLGLPSQALRARLRSLSPSGTESRELRGRMLRASTPNWVTVSFRRDPTLDDRPFFQDVLSLEKDPLAAYDHVA